MGPGIGSAADLKFLHQLPQSRPRNFKSKSGTTSIALLVPLLFPKFAREVAAAVHELRKRGTSDMPSQCAGSKACRCLSPDQPARGLDDFLQAAGDLEIA